MAHAISETDVPRTLSDFYNQRRRWNQGMMTARRHARGIEGAFVSAGYLDRVALLLVVVLIALGVLSPWWLAAYILPAVASVLTAVVKARPRLGLAATALASLPMMFAVDVWVSLFSLIGTITGKSLHWRTRPSAANPSAASHLGNTDGGANGAN